MLLEAAILEVAEKQISTADKLENHSIGFRQPRIKQYFGRAFFTSRFLEFSFLHNSSVRQLLLICPRRTGHTFFLDEKSKQKNQGGIHFLTLFSLTNWEIKETPFGQTAFISCPIC